MGEAAVPVRHLERLGGRALAVVVGVIVPWLLSWTTRMFAFVATTLLRRWETMRVWIVATDPPEDVPRSSVSIRAPYMLQMFPPEYCLT